MSQDADELALADLQSSDLETVDRIVNAPAATQQTSQSSFEDPSFSRDDGPQDNTLGSVAPPSPTGAHVEFRDKVDRERRNRRLFGVSMIWVITLALLGTFAILGYTFRQPIVDRNPAMASLYKIFDVNVKKKGLDFEAPSTRRVNVDGVPNLIVTFKIINRSNTSQPIPMIELSFTNNAGESVAKWYVEPSQGTLQAQERLEYVTQYPNPPLDAVDLAYRFVDDTDVVTEQDPEAEHGNDE